MAKESGLDKQIAKACAERRACHFKIHGNEFQRGVPDHLIGYKGRFVALEAKTETGLSPLQRRNLRVIQATGNIAEVCYDANLVHRIFDCIDEGREWKNGEY